MTSASAPDIPVSPERKTAATRGYGASDEDAPLPETVPHVLTSPLTIPTPSAEPSSDAQPPVKLWLAPGFAESLVLVPMEFCGFCVLWVSIAELVQGAFVSFLILATFYSVWTSVITCQVYSGDPGKVFETIERFESGQTEKDSDVVAVIERLRHTSPQIFLDGEVKHRRRFVREGDDAEWDTEFSKRWYLKFARWRDLSGPLADLDQYNMARVTVNLGMEPDDPTKSAMSDAKKAILKYCRVHHSGLTGPGAETGSQGQRRQARRDGEASLLGQVGSSRYDWDIQVHDYVYVNDPFFGNAVGGDGFMVARGPGKSEVPRWMDATIYLVMSAFSMGSLFRLWFYFAVPQVVYTLRKEISVAEEP